MDGTDAMPAGVMSRAIVTGVAAAVLAGTVMAAEPPPMTAAEPLVLTTQAVPLDPADPARRDVGRLRYLGGVELRSRSPRFGGISGLRAGRDGWLLGITDAGAWISLRTVERGDRLLGATGGTLAPLRDEQGNPPRAKVNADAEGLTFDPDTGDALVSLEQDHRIIVYRGIDPARPASFGSAAVRTIRPPEALRWPANGGGEGLAVLASGETLMFAEEGQDAAGASPVLDLAPAGTRVLRYAPPEGFRPTDAIEVSPGQVLVLNRRFSPAEGVSATLTLVTLGETIASREIARLGAGLSVDNMEGMALVRRDGRTFVYLVSDDNFNAFQRTLLLKFELLAE